MTILKKSAIKIGTASILLAISFQLFNAIACYDMNLLEMILSIWFPLIPLLPAFLALRSSNPLKAIGASFVAILFYLLAYYVDCVVPYEGGGASMIYVAVIMYGLPLAFLASWITGMICKRVSINIE